MNRVRKIARKWEEEGREGSLKVLAANKADTAARKRKYCKKVEPRGVVQSKPTKVEYGTKTVSELRAICKRVGLKGYSSAKKDDLVHMLIEHDNNVNDKENSNEQ